MVKSWILAPPLNRVSQVLAFVFFFHVFALLKIYVCLWERGGMLPLFSIHDSLTWFILHNDLQVCSSEFPTSAAPSFAACRNSLTAFASSFTTPIPRCPTHLTGRKTIDSLHDQSCLMTYLKATIGSVMAVTKNQAKCLLSPNWLANVTQKHGISLHARCMGLIWASDHWSAYGPGYSRPTMARESKEHTLIECIEWLKLRALCLDNYTFVGLITL